MARSSSLNRRTAFGLLLLSFLCVVFLVLVSSRMYLRSTAQVIPVNPGVKLTVQQKSLAATDTVVVNQHDVNLLRFEASAAQPSGVLLTKTVFTASRGSLADAQHYTLWADMDGDQTVDAIIREASPSADGTVTFEPSTLLPGPEECESNADCGEGRVCTGCRCTTPGTALRGQLVAPSAPTNLGGSSPQENAWRTLDKDADRSLSPTEAVQGLLGWGMTVNRNKGQQGFNAAFDFDANRRVNNGDFSYLSVVYAQVPQDTRRAQKAFRTLDNNGNFIVTPEEARNTYRLFATAFRSRTGEAAFRPVFDFDESGEIGTGDWSYLSLVVSLLPPNVRAVPFPSMCGNGTKEGTEQCDDGNRVNGDGCSAACTIEPGTNVALTAQIMGPPIPGQNVEYRLTVTNKSSREAKRVYLRDYRASNKLTLQRPLSDPNCTVAEDQKSVGCFGPENGFTLTPAGTQGSTRTFTLVYAVPPTVGCNTHVFSIPIVNVAGTTDTNVADNAWHLTVPVQCNGVPVWTGSPSFPTYPAGLRTQTDLAVTKELLTPFIPGKPVKYRVTVRNEGQQAANGVYLIDYLGSPPNMTFVPSPEGEEATDPCALTEDGKTVVCHNSSAHDPFNLSPGASKEFILHYVVSLNASCSASIENVAAMNTLFTTDTNQANNSVRLRSPVSCCGNGVLNPPEECDDGDTVKGDGCSDVCRIQAEGTRCISPSDCPSSLVCSTLYGVCNPVACPSDVPCQLTCAGTCVEQATCRDSDGGKVYTVWGETSGVSPSTHEVYEGSDLCGSPDNPYVRDGALVEHYCDGVFHTNEIVPCPNGCENGACKSICGNGVTEGYEPCDDGNSQNGDGCSDLCQFEIQNVEVSDDRDYVTVSLPESATMRHVSLQYDIYREGETEKRGDGGVLLAGPTIQISGFRSQLDAAGGPGSFYIGFAACPESFQLTGTGIREGCGPTTTVQFHYAPSAYCGNGLVEAGEGCDNSPCSNGFSCANCQCRRTGTCGNGLLDSAHAMVYEVHADMAAAFTSSELQLAFAERSAEAEDSLTGRSLTGISHNGSCGSNEPCEIATETLDSTLFHLRNQGDLYISLDSLPVSSRQILAGTVGETVLNLRLHAENEDIEVRNLVLYSVATPAPSVAALELWLRGGTRELATSGTCGALATPRDNATPFCFTMANGQLVIPKGADVRLLIRPRVKTDNDGAVSGEPLTIALFPSRAEDPSSVIANGRFSSNLLARNDGDTEAEGEVFIGTASPSRDFPMPVSENVIVLSKLISIANGGQDRAAVPMGADREIGAFTFAAAQNSNTRNGTNKWVLSDVIFTVQATNVDASATGFKIFKKDATRSQHVSCTPYDTSGTELSGTVSGMYLVRCSGLSDPNSPVNTAVDSGESVTLVLLANITNENTAAANGGSSMLQVTLNDFSNANSRTFGLEAGQSHLRWNDRDAGASTAFTWTEFTDTVVQSTLYGDLSPLLTSSSSSSSQRPSTDFLCCVNGRCQMQGSPCASVEAARQCAENRCGVSADCGNHVCTYFEENMRPDYCAADCCGNGRCSVLESTQDQNRCPSDCPRHRCGNWVCEPEDGETRTNCEDCMIVTGQ